MRTTLSTTSIQPAQPEPPGTGISLANGPHARHYSRQDLWRKLQRFALRLGRGAVQTTLTLFYCLQDHDTPAWAKGVIMGALGYLILPIDAIPDFIPVVGFTDDLGAISAALGTVAIYVKDQHKQKARDQMRRLFDMLLPGRPIPVDPHPTTTSEPTHIPVRSASGTEG
ncbi:hypothetical protein BH23VER1_BH23VER1_33870 [soil metagenome]